MGNLPFLMYCILVSYTDKARWLGKIQKRGSGGKGGYRAAWIQKYPNLTTPVAVGDSVRAALVGDAHGLGDGVAVGW